MKTPYELYGWEIGEGWVPMVKELTEKLKDAGWDGNLFQCKEKFGGLRFYIGSGNDEVYKLIDEYEKKSYTVCQDCGKEGKLREGGWIRTLCDDDAKKRGYND